MDRLTVGRNGTARAFVRIGPRSAPRMRLLCVPYAGAGPAVFRSFSPSLPAGVEVWAVRLPARESRLTEPPVADLPTVVAALVEEFADTDPFGDPPLPYALFGHSMGGLVCFELAHAMRRHGLPTPAHLFVSARRAPRIHDDQAGIHRLPSDQFLAEVTKLGGIPAEVLAEPGLIDLIMPALRADFAICHTYRYAADAPLSCGISVFGGRSDPTTTTEQLAAWRAETAGPFAMNLYPGGHFFLHQNQQDLLAEVSRVLDGR
ncbi:thioesterase II family protein [Actinophytocola sp.]|uniref:thioesterase II family protein n=1 Tax=Actinophytocola sp. TaxID=1872138 RepID=UPI003D6AA12F